MKMMARIIQGDDVDLVFSVKDKANNDIDLTGATAITFKMKKTIEGDSYVSKTLDDGIALSSPATEVTVTLTNADTADSLLPAGVYLFELQVTDSDGKVSTIRDFNDGFGKIEVLADLDQ